MNPKVFKQTTLQIKLQFLNFVFNLFTERTNHNFSGIFRNEVKLQQAKKS